MKEYIFSNDDLYAVEMRRFDELKELIRCKDCKWYEMSEEETYCRELGIFDTDFTSYCSYAKRKEE